MNRLGHCCLPRFSGLRRLAGGLLLAGLPVLGAGCQELGPLANILNPPAPTVRAAAGDPVGELPSPQSLPSEVAPLPTTADKEKASRLPISLDTVLRLADEQNRQIALARTRVREASAEKAVAEKRWLPDIYVGTAYYRHDGGIQNEDGTLTRSSFNALFSGLELDARLDIRDLAFQRVNAARKAWQQRGDLSRVTNETLLDASATYIDLLTIRTGVSIITGVEEQLHALHERAAKLAKVEKGAQVELARVQAELAGRRQAKLKLNEQASAASAKLVYLLGLDPCTELIPIDARIIPFDLVDANQPTCDLVNQALTQGPGVREMEGLLALIHENIERSRGPGRFLPVFELKVAEGGFGAGPNSQMDWSNRCDVGLQARWNLTNLAALSTRREVTAARIQQAHLAYEDLRAKLTLGVQEAQNAILSGREQIELCKKQIGYAEEARKLSHTRLVNNIPGSSSSEVLLSMGALGLAQINYLGAIREYDKAQLRLLLLTGSVIPLPAAP